MRAAAPIGKPKVNGVEIHYAVGGSQRPPAGYDTATMADDVVELATYLRCDQFRVAGEDWGAAIAYAVAAFHRPRMQQRVFQETLLPGLPGGERDPSLDINSVVDTGPPGALPRTVGRIQSPDRSWYRFSVSSIDARDEGGA